MAVFQSNCSSLSDFNVASPYQNLPNESVVIDSTGGPDSSACLKVTCTTTSANEIGVRRAETSSNIRKIAFKYKMDTAASLGNDQEHTLLHVWRHSGGTDTDLVQIRLKGASSQYRFLLRDGVGFGEQRLCTKKF